MGRLCCRLRGFGAVMDLAQAALVREERQVAPNPVARDLRLSDRSSTVTRAGSRAPGSGAAALRLSSTVSLLTARTFHKTKFAHMGGKACCVPVRRVEVASYLLTSKGPRVRGPDGKRSEALLTT